LKPDPPLAGAFGTFGFWADIAGNTVLIMKFAVCGAASFQQQ
jgi:hypothetical protein